jgi:hypothetical protein
LLLLAAKPRFSPQPDDLYLGVIDCAEVSVSRARASTAQSKKHRKSANMRDHIRCGASFQAIMAEFTTKQIRELRKDCRNLIASARLLESAEYRAGAIPFDNEDGYAFILERVATSLWSLEVGQLPPHAAKGMRVPAARRERERRERREQREKAIAARPQRARRPRRTRLERLLVVSYKRTLRSEVGHNLRKLAPAVVAVLAAMNLFCRNVMPQVNAGLCSVQDNLFSALRRTLRYAENCEREGRIDTTLDLSSGMRLERRLFKIGRLEIPLNTWAPIDPGFDQIWDISLFGVRLLESECL